MVTLPPGSDCAGMMLRMAGAEAGAGAAAAGAAGGFLTRCGRSAANVVKSAAQISMAATTNIEIIFMSHLTGSTIVFSRQNVCRKPFQFFAVIASQTPPITNSRFAPQAATTGGRTPLRP